MPVIWWECERITNWLADQFNEKVRLTPRRFGVGWVRKCQQLCYELLKWAKYQINMISNNEILFWIQWGGSTKCVLADIFGSILYASATMAVLFGFIPILMGPSRWPCLPNEERQLDGFVSIRIIIIIFSDFCTANSKRNETSANFARQLDNAINY